MSSLALITDRPDIYSIPLENPRQTAAFDYCASYSPKSPKFSRAMAVTCDTSAVIFISGTASITHSETRHESNPAAQTAETLDNIAALISEENTQRHGLPGAGCSLDDLAVARVYVKNAEDYPTVRAVVDARLRKAPTSFTIADVCRPDLLVEIEGIAFSRRAPR